MRPLVLIVEDDDDVRETTALVLERQGFAVHTARDGAEGYEAAMRVRPDVAVVDVAMPRVDGLALTRSLSDMRLCPVLLLTARDLPDDELTGFEAGAQDYVAKPFESRVLAARLRALIRRGERPSAARTVGPITIDTAARSVTRDGRPVTLSPTEFRLLALLIEHRGIALTRSTILARVWGSPDWAHEHLVDVNIQRLRARIGPGIVTTVRGTGYRVDET
jgi:DNA-binding response OmpR family regulator